MHQPKLLIATRNPGKMREYRQLLLDVPFELVSLEGLGISEEVEESGHTFEENATLKATTYGALAGLLTWADDSGLEVDALGGAPGVYSARYGEKSPLTPLYERGGHAMSDLDRVELLLRNLEGVPWERRTARFRCVIAITTPPKPLESSASLPSSEGLKSPPFAKGDWGDLAPGVTLLVGSVAGMIQYEPVGNEGFGYDPVFYLPSYGQTMAQLPLEEKNRISHRSHAAGKAVKVLTATK